eukprot:748771-Amphidinium_carterae.1
MLCLTTAQYSVHSSVVSTSCVVQMMPADRYACLKAGNLSTFPLASASGADIYVRVVKCTYKGAHFNISLAAYSNTLGVQDASSL